MTKAIKAEIIGLAQFKAQLERLGDAANADALETAATSGMMLIQNPAKQKAPVETGDLRRSIHIETEEKRKNYVMVVLGTDKVYGPIQEFGGIVKNAFGRGEQFTVTIPAHPYMRPAWDENIAAAKREVGDALTDLMKATL